RSPKSSPALASRQRNRRAPSPNFRRTELRHRSEMNWPRPTLHSRKLRHEYLAPFAQHGPEFSFSDAGVLAVGKSFSSAPASVDSSKLVDRPRIFPRSILRMGRLCAGGASSLSSLARRNRADRYSRGSAVAAMVVASGRGHFAERPVYLLGASVATS